MGRAEHKRMHNKMKTKRKTKDADQIEEDMKPENMDKLLNQKVDYDTTGNAQFYCVHCARYFINDGAMKEHFRSKPHKRRLKFMETEAYSQKEADAAAGMGSYEAPRKRKVETQNVDTAEDMQEDDDTAETNEPKTKKRKGKPKTDN